MRVYQSNAYIIIPLTPTLSRKERELSRHPPFGEGALATAGLAETIFNPVK
jgi:hypothetical protein